ALFVDEGAEARGLIRRNMEAMQLNGHAKIFRRDATRLGSAGTMAPFDLAFLDPPYRRGFGEKALAALSTGKWLVNGAAVVLEEAQDTAIVVPSEYEVEEIRDYGAAALHLLRYCP
ncbi:MAG: RsmD family RNA methyltransferase, partial [Pseudomonadota bacterium]